MSVTNQADVDRVRAKLDAVRRPEDIPTPIVIDPGQQYVDVPVDPKVQSVEYANLELLEANLDGAPDEEKEELQDKLDDALAEVVKPGGDVKGDAEVK